ncbi:LuxR C-terminal-related transcriptional regulator [Ideonella sp. DXS29W]|uniref:LuxR C-terminal-related transcriptional regulator n=1 Tax=Ideonella lacteola TaxID=2984193 RepID=A0ABU9BUZ6_9BURK
MRLQDYFDISQAPDLATFRRRMIDFAHGMDFPIVGAVLLAEHAADQHQYLSYIGNRPPDFASASDKSLAKIDPVMAQLRRSPVPFVYDQKFYVDAGAPELWEHAAPYGYRTGISVALRLPGNKQLLLGLDRERDLPADDERIMRLLADLQMLAVHCQDAALRFLGPLTEVEEAPALSKRELEVLRWTKEGMTAWEVGDKLCISEPTVKFHLKKTLSKLQVPSKHMAVLKAISLGLIAP